MKPAPGHVYDSLLDKELGLYDSSNWWPTDETLVKKYVPLLFFKENETV